MNGYSKNKEWNVLFSRRRIMLYIDVIMMLLVLLILAPRITGLGLHEILGLLLLIPVIVHLLFSWKWISQTTKRLLFSTNKRTKFNYFLNAVLFILLVTEIFSGIMISQVALPSLGIHTIYDSSWRSLHNMMLRWIKIAIGIHIATNWKLILLALKNYISKSYVIKINNRVFISTVGITLWRISLMVLVALVISVCLYLLVGEPSSARLYHEDAIKRFRATVGHGLIQLTGQAFFLTAVVYVSLKWLKVRL